MLFSLNICRLRVPWCKKATLSVVKTGGRDASLCPLHHRLPTATRMAWRRLQQLWAFKCFFVAKLATNLAAFSKSPLTVKSNRCSGACVRGTACLRSGIAACSGAGPAVLPRGQSRRPPRLTQPALPASWLRKQGSLLVCVISGRALCICLRPLQR